MISSFLLPLSRATSSVFVLVGPPVCGRLIYERCAPCSSFVFLLVVVVVVFSFAPWPLGKWFPVHRPVSWWRLVIYFFFALFFLSFFSRSRSSFVLFCFCFTSCSGRFDARTSRAAGVSIGPRPLPSSICSGANADDGRQRQRHRKWTAH